MISSAPEAGKNIFWRVAIPLFYLTSFLLVSRILDPLGKHFRITGALLLLLGVTLVASRRVFALWESPSGKVLPFFAAWIAVTYFMTPHDQAGRTVLQSFVQGMLLFIAAASLLSNVAEFKKLFTILAFAGLVASVLGIVWSNIRIGRFSIRDGPYQDANYYAMCLLGVMPIIWVTFVRNPLWIKICGALATALPLLIVFRTASRGALIGIFAMELALFFLYSLKLRLWIIGLNVAALVIGLAFLPASIQSRLASSMRMESPAEAQSVAQASTVARQTLLQTSIEMTLDYPLFGVGPGNFGSTVVEVGRSQGVEWLPLSTHNSYTQMSSESGIPGFLLFVTLIGLSFWSASSVLRQSAARGANPDPDLHRMASALLVSLAATFTCLTFLSEAYNFMVYFWLGVPCGLWLLLPRPSHEEEGEEEMIETVPEPTVPPQSA